MRWAKNQRDLHDSLIFTIAHPFDQAALFQPLDDVGDSRCVNPKTLSECADGLFLLMGDERK